MQDGIAEGACVKSTAVKPHFPSQMHSHMQRSLACFATFLALVLVAWSSASLHASPADRLGQAAGVDSQTLLGNLSTELEYLTAPSTLRFQQAAAAPSGDWRRADKPTLNIGYQPDGAWVRFRLSNPNAEPLRRLLVVDWSFERIDARVLESGRWSAMVSTGSEVAPDQRDVTSPVMTLPLTLPPGPSEVYLRLESTQPMVVPLRLSDPAAFDVKERNENLRMGAFFGAMLVMLLYNASLFVFTRDRSYLYYCGYLLASGFYVASEFGYGPYLLWSGWDWLVPRANILSASLAFLAAGIFERQFLDLKREGGWILRCSNILVGYWAFAVLVVAIDPWFVQHIHIEHGGSIACVLAISIAFVVWRRGNASAGYFLVAWVGLLGMTLLVTLSMAGLFPMNNHVRSGQLVGFVLEFLLLSIALAERINREKAARLQAQAALLALQEEANALLEDRVASRTQQLEQANQELQRLSNTDPLTGLSNRRGFEDRLNALILRGCTEGAHLTYLMLDIDHFKGINDRYGHGCGDECLALIGQTLSNFSRRDNEFAARLGGEEFAAVFYGMPPAKASTIAEQIRAAVADLELRVSEGSIRFSVSIGVAAWVPAAGDTQLAFATAADEALYQTKATGRNRVCMAERV